MLLKHQTTQGAIEEKTAKAQVALAKRRAENATEQLADSEATYARAKLQAARTTEALDKVRPRSGAHCGEQQFQSGFGRSVSCSMCTL